MVIAKHDVGPITLRAARSSGQLPRERGGAPGRRLRVLAVTRIFPNSVEPLACAFNRQQLTALSRLADVEVAAVIPHLPGARMLLGDSRVARLADVPEREVIDGVPVLHPRVGYVPGGGSLLAPLNVPLYVAGLLPLVPMLRDRFDVVLGTYLYPDACAAGALARVLGLPFAVKVHGTDVNTVGSWRSVQPIIRRMLRKVGAAIAVSRPMTERLVELGAPRERCALVRNGVDRAVFHPRDRAEARRALGLPEEGKLAVFVGRLVPEKGLRELMTALSELPDVRGALVGEGGLRHEIEARAEALGGRISLPGDRPLDEVATWLAAADVLVLPRWAEGTPNVVLEALAAGRPVVATSVGGIPDVVEHGRTGLLVPPGDAAALRAALDEALSRRWDPAALAAAAPPTWDESAGHLHELLREVAAARTPGGVAPGTTRVAA